MPTLHLIYGFTGAGKRTFARQLEQEVRGVRSSPDEWMVALYGTDPPVQYFQAFRARTIQVIWDLAARVLQLGLDVILDFGFWTRASRDDARARARALGVAWKLYLLDCSEEVMRRRVLERTARMPAGALVIDEAAFELFKSRFEPLALDEEHTRIQTDDWDTDGSGRGVRLANAAMATLFLICGLPGSGKTRLAKQLELSRPALRLSPDEWIALLLSDLTDTAERDRLRSPVESLQWEVARRVLALGIDVVLEWGFWSREERARYRVQAEQLGARVELRYLAVERDELWARLSRRNANLPPVTFAVTEDQLDLWWSLFEPPSADELGLQS